MQAVEIKNLNFSYGKRVVFDNLSVNIEAESFTTILGANGAGKTTLARILSGNFKFKGEILLFNKDIHKNNFVTLVVADMDDYDEDEIVMNVLKKAVKGYKKEEKILEIATDFKFNKSLNKYFKELSWNEKILMVLVCGLLQKSKILIIDNIFEMVDETDKNRTLTKLKKYAKETKMTIVNITNDSEDVLKGDNIIILGDGKVILSGSKKAVLEETELFETRGLCLPFIVDLSNKLKFYELIDKTYYLEKKLVDDLWE